ncbi:UDP-glucose 4-epimerase GalE [Eubacteriales bacterium OttesenSCG-928-A19]|nr:UDP-glucose 4-epimerase GalE [Eubacteriales bacterium OttesenSCG-928-A19]
MNILVTGGAGYIGSHTCVELLGAGHSVVIVDNLSNAKPEVLDKIRQIAGRDFTFIKADLRDRSAMADVFAKEAIDAVIHFAGLKSVGESVEKPLEYYDNNLIGTLVLLEEMRRRDVKRMVFSSSATVYGNDNPVPFREEYPTSAINPYGYTKVVIERMLSDLAVSDPTWSIATLRYFNPIGAHSSGLIGEDPNGIPSNLFPYIMQVAAGLLEKVYIYGDDYDTPDGTGVRDYIHVVDLALGHLSALDYVSKHTGVEAVNLGTGQGTSVFELIHAFEDACHYTIPYEVTSRRIGDIAAGYADPSRAKALYGWTAQRTIHDMCVDGWRFAKAHYGVGKEAGR